MGRRGEGRGGEVSCACGFVGRVWHIPSGHVLLRIGDMGFAYGRRS